MAWPIDVGVAGSHHEFRIASGQLFQICLERARIFGQILVRAELARVDIDPYDRHVALSLRGPHQTQVSCMEGPHRWHEAYSFSRAAIREQCSADFSDGLEDAGKHSGQ